MATRSAKKAKECQRYWRQKVAEQVADGLGRANGRLILKTALRHCRKIYGPKRRR